MNDTCGSDCNYNENDRGDWYRTTLSIKILSFLYFVVSYFLSFTCCSCHPRLSCSCYSLLMSVIVLFFLSLSFIKLSSFSSFTCQPVFQFPSLSFLPLFFSFLSFSCRVFLFILSVVISFFLSFCYLVEGEKCPYSSNFNFLSETTQVLMTLHVSILHPYDHIYAFKALVNMEEQIWDAAAIV